MYSISLNQIDPIISAIHALELLRFSSSQPPCTLVHSQLGLDFIAHVLYVGHTRATLRQVDTHGRRGFR